MENKKHFNYKSKVVEVKHIKLIKIINNILLIPLIIYFLAIFNGIFSIIEFYKYISDYFVNNILYYFPIILSFYIFTLYRRYFQSLSLSISLSIIAFCISSVFTLFALFSTMCGYNSGGILYISKHNNNNYIELLNFDCGAFSSSSKYFAKKVYDFPPIFKYTSKVDTNDFDFENWIKIKFELEDFDFSGNSLYKNDLKKLNNLPDSSFKFRKLQRFDKIILPLQDTHKISDYTWFYSVQRRKYFFRSFVFYSGGELILQTTDYNSNNIDCIEVYREINEEDYNLIKTSYFENDSVLIINKDYETFELDENKKLNTIAKVNINFKTRYLINYKGEIEKLSKNKLGEVKITLSE